MDNKMVLIKTAPDKILQGQWYYRPWLGIATLAAFLEKKGIECNIIDAFFHRLSLKETVGRAKESGGNIFAITAMTHEIKRAHEVAVSIKESIQDSFIIIGGPHITALPVRTMEEFPSFDFGVVGEGELPLFELFNAIKNKMSFEPIKGLAFRENGQVRVIPGRQGLEDLDSLPFPSWHLYPRVEEYPVYSARGCPFSCSFCMRVLGNKVRYRSPENVVQEMEYLVSRFNAKRISFQDETFTVNIKRVYTLIDLIIQAGLHKKVKWDICARVTGLDYDLCKKLKDAGCYMVGMGIESGSNEILRRVGKGITISDAIKGVKAVKEAGLQTDAFYIIGHPNETRDDINKTIDFAAKLNTTLVAFGIMVPYPGTAIYDMAVKGEGGYKMVSLDWSDFDKHLGNALELQNINRKELEKLQIKAYLTFYIKNLRVRELFKFILEKRKAVFFMLKKLLKSAALK